ncbi:alpha/beta hydrolase [Actinomyces slackii]|uniref:Esterase/lipase n=1 Tax=Actinomyces slackii TaxID=52774 RepID=A0A448KAP9_9ACTO|nr:alpha/beta hydrolase [Actinomyces slackii]VEG73999.1 Esterase/lipase [Actinomyces slackii]
MTVPPMPSEPAEPIEATEPPRPERIEASGIEPDLLGEPWVARRIPVTPAPEAAVGDHAVLVHQRQAGGRHDRAVLHLHGRSDYFFQTHMAQAFLDAGYEFYALDLRACGRAGIGLPSPHDVRDLRVHAEEIRRALRIIRSEHGHGEVVLHGHSTGGLQAVIWAADHPGTVDAVVLNSPWLDLRGTALVRSYGSALVDLISRRWPDRVIDDPGASRDKPDVYVEALHRDWSGEWDWDLRLKPFPAFPVRAGFLAGVRRLQRRVHHGLGIRVPILLCCSTTTGSPDADLEEAKRSDVVLSVEQMIARAPFLGNDVTVRQIPDGVHDLSLSGPRAREEYFAAVTGWLAARLG